MTASLGLYEILQSKQSSGSGRGGSYYSTPALCGMQGRLKALFPYEEKYDEDAQYTPTGRRKINARRAGTFFHALQEMWRLDAIPENMAIAADHADHDYEVALNSFIRYRTHFNNDRHNLGRIAGVEITLPQNDEQSARVREIAGGEPLTMRYDLLTEISNEDMVRIAVERQLSLPGPGLYLIDYKLVGSISANTMWQYSYDFQQLSYPVIYNACFPERPVRGMLTEVTARVQKPEPRHYALYLAYADARATDIVRHGVLDATAKLAAGKANPFACMGKFGPCFFLTNGTCPRHGTFDQFQQLGT